MSEPYDKKPFDGPVTGRQSIREVMEALRRAQEEEALQERRRELRERREAKQARIKRQRSQQEAQLKARKTRRQNALRNANDRVSRHVAAASRELGAALRGVAAVKVSRYSPEGREQLRVRRSLEDALNALRQVGRGGGINSDIDPDLDSGFED